MAYILYPLFRVMDILSVCGWHCIFGKYVAIRKPPLPPMSCIESHLSSPSILKSLAVVDHGMRHEYCPGSCSCPHRGITPCLSFGDTHGRVRARREPPDEAEGPLLVGPSLFEPKEGGLSDGLPVYPSIVGGVRKWFGGTSWFKGIAVASGGIEMVT